MNAWSQPLAPWLFDFVWMATALLLAAATLRLLLHDPASRVQLAWATWLSVIGTAVLVASPTWPRWEVQRLFQARTASPAIIAAVEQTAPSEPLVFIEPADLGTPPIDKPTASTHVHIAWKEWFATIWLTAGIAACCWIAVGYVQARRLVHTSQPAPSWIVEELKSIVSGSLPDVRISRRLSSAIALGAIHPRILLPHSSAEPLNANAIRAALAHEWAHIRHGDLWFLALERLLVPLLMLHPLFWWLRRSTRLDQELLADAAAAGQQPVEYAEALLAWAKSPANSTVGLTALAMWDRPTNLTRRVHMILNEKRPQQTWLTRLAGALAACTVLGASLALSVLTVAAQQPADEPAVPQNQQAVEPTSTPSPAAVPSTVTPTPAPTAEPLAAPTTTPAPQPRPTATNASPSANNDKVITLKLALFALNHADFPKTRKEVIDSVGQIAGRALLKGEAVEQRNTASPRFVEIDSSRDSDLVMDIQSIDGVKLVSRATIVAMSGQEARLQMEEPGPRIEIEQEVNGNIVQRDQWSGIAYSVRLKPQLLGGGSTWNIDIEVGRGQVNVQQPTTVLKTTVSVGRTLVMVSSEPYALLVTPIKAEPQVTGVRPGASAAITEAKMAGVPATYPVPTPPSGSTFTPIPGTFQTTPSLIPGTFQPAPHPVPTPSTRPLNAARLPTVVEVPMSAPPLPVTTTTAAVPGNAAQRKLLELDLAEAKLDVQLAEAELADLEEIRKKTPQAASLSELRKRQLQVERAKIQMRRIEIRLDATKAPPETTPPLTPSKPT